MKKTQDITKLVQAFEEQGDIAIAQSLLSAEGSLLFFQVLALLHAQESPMVQKLLPHVQHCAPPHLSLHHLRALAPCHTLSPIAQLLNDYGARSQAHGYAVALLRGENFTPEPTWDKGVLSVFHVSSFFGQFALLQKWHQERDRWRVLCDEYGAMPGHYAPYAHDPALLRYTLTEQVRQHRTHAGQSVLHAAVDACFHRGVSLLLEEGCDPFMYDAHGVSPYLATIAQDDGPLFTMMQRSAQIPWNTLLLHLVAADAVWCFRLSAPSNVAQWQDEHGCCLFHFIAEHGALQILEEVQEYGAINWIDQDGKTPLMYSMGQSVVFVRQLLECGGDPNMIDHQSQTVLHHALKQTQPHVAHYIITQMHQHDQPDHAGWTPVALALQRGWDHVAMTLFQHGVSLQWQHKKTNLAHLACQNRCWDAVQHLVATAPSLFIAYDRYGQTPCHYALDWEPLWKQYGDQWKELRTEEGLTLSVVAPDALKPFFRTLQGSEA